MGALPSNALERPLKFFLGAIGFGFACDLDEAL